MVEITSIGEVYIQGSWVAVLCGAARLNSYVPTTEVCQLMEVSVGHAVPNVGMLTLLFKTAHKRLRLQNILTDAASQCHKSPLQELNLTAIHKNFSNCSLTQIDQPAISKKI